MTRFVPFLLALAAFVAGCDSSAVQPPPDPPPEPVCEPAPVPDPSGPEGRLLFNDAADGRLYSARPDGSDLRDHTPSNVDAFAAVWSPDRSRIAFLSADSLYASDGNALFVMDADDPESAEVLYLWPGPGDLYDRVLRGRWLAWSPDGRYVAMRVCRVYLAGCLSPDIAVVDVEADTLGWLTDDPHRDTKPVWNRDGTAVAFTSRDASSDDPFELQYYSVSIGTSVRDTLAYRKGGIGGALSPDWKRLATTLWTEEYGLWDVGCEEFRSLNLDTSARIAPTVWAQDGSRYAGIDHDGEDRGLYLVDARTGATTQPFPDRPLITYVDWR